MSQTTVYVLHKNGAPNHYKALDYFLQQKGKTLKHREFSVVGNLYKSIIKLNFSLFKKQLLNLSFLITLVFSKNKKIVFGIAPFDKKLTRLLPLLRKHTIYYHSSWTCWDGSFQPKTVNGNAKVMHTWREFLEQRVAHIFAVSSVTKEQLLENFGLKENTISIVHHTLRDDFLQTEEKERDFDCIYIGRLVPQKGIQELLNFFANRKDKTLTIIGDGKLENLVKSYADKHLNIRFKGKINDAALLKSLLQQHRYLVLNSLKTEKWEELFGIVIIESMSQGVIPISTNHAGPRSIINDDIGYLYNEGALEAKLTSILSESYQKEKSAATLATSKFYSVENISQFWAAIEN
ncbi:MAG: glycosyltransferase [Flavobacteriaceae bacterium]|nr:glycosyltransferase [Flavobacteriaceae bacterium]